jgi:response regulator NasT
LIKVDSSFKIVIVDKNPIRAAILEEGLREAGHVHVVRIEETAHLLARIYAIDPDVILIDLESTSRDVLEQMFVVASAAKARAELGWTPAKPDLRDIVADAWEFHQRSG